MQLNIPTKTFKLNFLLICIEFLLILLIVIEFLFNCIKFQFKNEQVTVHIIWWATLKLKHYLVVKLFTFREY